MQRLIAALMLALCASTAQGATYDFNTYDFTWTGVHATGIYTATGQIDIAAAPGAAFGLAQVLRASVTISGPGIPTFTFGALNSAGGHMSADGALAMFSAQGNPFARSAGGESFFGCLAVYCRDGRIRLRASNGTGSFDFLYASPAAALASMRMTQHVPPASDVPAPVPLPATGMLVLAAIGSLAVLRRRRARRA